ncbi:hypothetical protein [Stenotrophomonas phage vB_SmaS_P15]|uniref:Uncharacterized protein n=1 Tax=Stenotrophomonas phage vB_SmaS_P15 TaxID=2894592 RepID=A0AAE9C6T7_9CAUD|nr:hypothetical protein [Stenotrophomonas phage vB_SmaS_P15]
MDAAKLIGDVGSVLIVAMVALMIWMNFQVGKHWRERVKQRRSLSYLNYPRVGGLREYLTRPAAMLNGVFGEQVKREMTPIWFFYQFGGFLILVNLLYMLWYKIGTYF